MRRLFNCAISIIYTQIRFFLYKIFCKGLDYCWNDRFSPNVVLEFARTSRVKIGKFVRVHSGSKIKVRSDGILELQDDVAINYNCIFICRNKIIVGEHTMFGPNVCIYDHDHDFRTGLNNNSYLSSPVIIGKNCWIGANTLILRGTVLGDNCVVGAGSIIKGEYKSNSLIIQKRNTSVTSIDYGN